MYFRKLFILICLGVLATLAEVSAVEFPQNKFFTINSETFFFGSEERGSNTNYGETSIKFKGETFYRNEYRIKNYNLKENLSSYGLYLKGGFSRVLFGIYKIENNYEVNVADEAHPELTELNLKIFTFQLAYTVEFSNLFFGDNAIGVGIGGGYANLSCALSACETFYPKRSTINNTVTNTFFQYGVHLGFLEVFFDVIFFTDSSLEIERNEDGVSNLSLNGTGSLYGVGLGLIF